VPHGITFQKTAFFIYLVMHRTMSNKWLGAWGGYVNTILQFCSFFL
jgi:hypothetical protein